MWILVWVLAAFVFVPAMMERLNGRQTPSVYLRMGLGLALMTLDMLALILFPYEPQPVTSYVIIGTITASVGGVATYMLCVYRRLQLATQRSVE